MNISLLYAQEGRADGILIPILRQAPTLIAGTKFITMLAIAILAGLALIMFRYSIQKAQERREDRQDTLRELRQQHLDMILQDKENEAVNENAEEKSK